MEAGSRAIKDPYINKILGSNNPMLRLLQSKWVGGAGKKIFMP